MSALAALFQFLPRLAALLAVAVAAYAGYELATEPNWRRRLAATAARVWVLGALGLVGAEGLLFEKNVVLVVAYQLGVSLGLAQAAFLVSLAAAVLVWTRD